MARHRRAERAGAAHGGRPDPRPSARSRPCAARWCSRTSPPASKPRCTTREGVNADDRARRSHAGRGRRCGARRRSHVAGAAGCLLGQHGAANPQAERDDLAGSRGRRGGRARSRPRGARARRWLGPLHGVPLAHKDMYYQAGKLSTCGSAHPQGLPPGDHRDRDREADRGRRLHVRRPEHGGVRAEPDRAQRDVRRLPQSVEPALHHRRLVVGFRRLGGGALQLCGAGLRHRRVDPAAGGGLRRDRHQADADPGVALWRDAAVVQRRQCRAAGAHRAGLRADHDADRRARSARPDQFAPAGAGLRGGAGRRPARPAHRRADQRISSTTPTRRWCEAMEQRGGGAGGARRDVQRDRACR